MVGGAPDTPESDSRAPFLTRLRVDPVACDGIGLCAHLAPDLVRVDSWGFPLLTRRPLGRREQRQANRAVAGCPRRALFLTEQA